MPYLPTAHAWLTQSALLLEARPTTTRITTKYTLSKPARQKRAAKPKEDPTATATATTTAAPTDAEPAPAPAPARATLTLKTYNPASGVTLKYRTDKAAEVGRLVAALARLGRSMAGLPEAEAATATGAEDVAMAGAGVAAEGAAEGAAMMEKGIPGGGAVGGQHGQQQHGGGGGGGGGGQGGKKGKKKGKK